MPKIAWAKRLYNAYNNVEKGDKVYDSNNVLVGVANGCYGRATYKSPGTVLLGVDKAVSGDVEKITNNCWKIVNKTDHTSPPSAKKSVSPVKIEPQCLITELN
jgi:hypothetical protein